MSKFQLCELRWLLLLLTGTTVLAGISVCTAGTSAVADGPQAQVQGAIEDDSAAQLGSPLSPKSGPLDYSDTLPAADGHYGPFGLFNRRSIYGTYWYPEPLRADESDVDNEIRADWFHAENHGRQFNRVKTEFEKSFGLLTLEIAPTYELDRTASFNPLSHATERDTQAGLGNVELGARHPFFQYVSARGFFDTTFVAGMEITFPSGSKISKDFELVPKLFNLTRIGDHLSVQTGLGNSIVAGPVGRGLSTLEYDAVFGYELTNSQLPLPGVLSTTSMLEFDGEYSFNQDSAGRNQLLGTAGFRFNFDSVSWLPAQPRLGVGYTFPVDKGARDEFHWGVVTSLVFEY